MPLYIDKVWLENLKVGDKVALRYGWNGIAIISVIKVTATQIQTNSGKYRRRDGRQIGETGRFNLNSIEPYTDVIRAEIEEKRMLRAIAEIEFKKLPIETIKQVLAIVEPVIEQQEKEAEEQRLAAIKANEQLAAASLDVVASTNTIEVKV
jgi:hypothetical protein